MSNNNKLFVWDFHGTLEYGNDFAVLEITNEILQMHGFVQRMSPDDAEMLAGRRWHEYFAFLLPELDKSHYLELQMACYDMSYKNPEIAAKHMKPTPNAFQVLEAIDKSPHTQIVLSNCHPIALDRFLNIVKFEHFFPKQFRIGADIPHPAHLTKKDWLADFLNDHQFPGGIVTIGDSPGDMELAECHPKSIRYLFSHPSRQHRHASCHYRINDLKHILQEI